MSRLRSGDSLVDDEVLDSENNKLLVFSNIFTVLTQISVAGKYGGYSSCRSGRGEDDLSSDEFGRYAVKS